jgi:serine/threonine protein kinase
MEDKKHERRRKVLASDALPARPALNQRRSSLDGEKAGRMEGHQVRKGFQNRSISADVGFHKLHEADFFPDPIPAVKVINKPEHVREFDEWAKHLVPKPLKYDRTSSKAKVKVEDLTTMYPTLGEAALSTDWAICKRFLGFGTFGQVYLGFRLSDEQQDLPDRHLCAVKQSFNNRKDIPGKDMLVPEKKEEDEVRGPFGQEKVRHETAMEIETLSSLVHVNIVKMMAHFAVAKTRAIYIILEYCDNLDLAKEQMRQPGRLFKQPVARFYFRQVVAALSYMHSKYVSHCDIKLTNILIKINADGIGKTAKLADFGSCHISMRMKSDGKKVGLQTSDVRGTPAYLAPEALVIYFKDNKHLKKILMRPYRPHPVSAIDKQNKVKIQSGVPPPALRRKIQLIPQWEKAGPFFSAPCDVYACGVLLYTMMAGAPPYNPKTWPLDLDYVFRLQPVTRFTHMDQQTWAFINRMLEPYTTQVDPAIRLRLTMQEVAAHAWMDGPATCLPPIPMTLDQYKTMYLPPADEDDESAAKDPMMTIDPESGGKRLHEDVEAEDEDPNRKKRQKVDSSPQPSTSRGAQ